MAKPNQYTEKAYGIAFQSPACRQMDGLSFGHEYTTVYLSEEAALNAIREYHAQCAPSSKLLQNPSYVDMTPIGIVYERYITPEQQTSAIKNPDFQSDVRNVRGVLKQNTRSVAAVISADKYSPETIVMRADLSSSKFESAIYDAAYNHLNPFRQRHFESKHPVAQYSDDPKYTLYIVDSVAHCEKFKPIHHKHDNAQVYTTYDAALLAASTMPPTYSKYHAPQDKRWQYAAQTPYPQTICPVQVPVQQYEKLQSWIRPNGYMCNEWQLNERMCRAYDGQSWRDNISTLKFGDIQTVVFGADKRHTAICYTANATPNFVATVNAEMQKRVAACQELAQKQWNDAHPIPEKQKYHSKEEERIATNDKELPNPNEANAGWKLISRWAKTLEETGHAEAAKELIVKYSQNVERFHDYNDETKRSAYRAMETVFGKVQREAVKRGDFETATAAQHVVRGAQGALDDMRLGAESQRVGITKEEAAEYGIYVEEEEVCV